MTRLAYLFSICIVARHTGFDVVQCLHGVEAAVDTIRETGHMTLRQYEIRIVAVSTLLAISVATDAKSLVGLRVEGVREFVIQRVGRSVEIVTLMAILTEVRVVASLTRLVAVDRRAGAGDIGVCVDEVGRVADGLQLLIRPVAKIAVDAGNRMLVMAVEALDHPRQHARPRDFGSGDVGVTALTRQLGLDMELVGENGTELLDSRHHLRVIDVRVARAALILVFNVVAVTTNCHLRKQVVSAGDAFFGVIMTVGANEPLLFEMIPVREDELGIVVDRKQPDRRVEPRSTQNCDRGESHEEKPVSRRLSVEDSGHRDTKSSA